MTRPMTQNTATRRILLKAIGSITLPLAIVGCQHSSHYATTQVVVQISPTQTAVAEVVAPEPSTQQPAAPATTEPVASVPAANEPAAAPTTQEEASSQPVPEIEAAPAAAGHGVGQMTRSAGHGVAEASRSVGHGVAQGARTVGSGAADLTTNSVQSIKNTPPESLTAPEIDVDEAMQARDWDQVTAGYASGATVAGPIGFLYEPRRDRPLWQQGVTEIPTFFVDSALIPYAFCKTPPWKPVEWKAATVAPTYTGVPPLPPE